MTLFVRRPVLRWLVPAVLALLLAAGGSLVSILSADAGGKLAPRTAAQLLVDVQKAKVHGLSGTIVQNADLGLPSLPGLGGSGSSDMTSLVSGSHTLRLWYAGPNKVRLALLGSLGESDVVRNGTDAWTWSSKDKSATHRSVPTTGADPQQSLASGSPMTPQHLAQKALEAISPSTKVSTDGTASVAGRPAYELVLQPRDGRSLIGSVRIAVDGKTHLPTRVQVFAGERSKPSFEVGFTSFDPTTPAASVFRFNPPPGTKVTQSGAESGAGAPTGRTLTRPHSSASSLSASPSTSSSAAATDEPRVVGEGWTSVVVTKLPAGALTGTAGGADRSGGTGGLARMLTALPKASGSWGSGHLLQGTLFSALLTDDGRLVVGAVAPEALYTALGR